MPRPPHLCSCGKIVPHGARCEHQRAQDSARKARFDKSRPSARQRGYDGKWQRERRLWLEHHPRCAFCGEPAGVVDHITPHRGDQKLFWDWRNWQSLCAPCHDRAKQRQERRP